MQVLRSHGLRVHTTFKQAGAADFLNRLHGTDREQRVQVQMESLQNKRKTSRGKQKTSLGQKALELHKRLRGKIEVRSKVSARTPKESSIVYTPGVAEVCLEIAADRQKAYEYTNKWNNVAIVTDGTRTLGLGSLVPEAALPG